MIRRAVDGDDGLVFVLRSISFLQHHQWCMVWTEDDDDVRFGSVRRLAWLPSVSPAVDCRSLSTFMSLE